MRFYGRNGLVRRIEPRNNAANNLLSFGRDGCGPRPSVWGLAACTGIKSRSAWRRLGPGWCIPAIAIAALWARWLIELRGKGS